MADQFAGFPIAATTRHFLITYAGEGDADAAARAQAIGSSCEADLDKLEVWFSCNYDSSPYGIWVHVAPGKHLGGASNTGYDNEQSSRLSIFGTYAPPNAAPNATLRDEMARMLFVAELAEILMEFTASSWLRGDSRGEGLSILAAETLHPIGYYGTGQGPRINAWLRSPRRDWVSTSEGTDTNALSYGCAVLFLNYLRYQLGFSFEQIVSAGGSIFLLVVPPNTSVSLADVFFKLTGRPATSAFAEFSAVLQAHLPMGQNVTMPRDNVFPLRDAARRTVGFSTADVEMNAAQDPETLFVELQAGPLCRPNVYTYHNVKVSTQLSLSGRAVGFAQPSFGWTLNGQALIGSSSWQSTTVTLHATDTRPGRGEPAIDAALPVQYLVNTTGAASTLLVRNMAFPGNGALTVGLSAVESLVAGDAATVFTDTPTLLTRRYAMSRPWASDVATCNPKEYDVVSQELKVLVHRLADDLNRPNPNPTLVRALATLSREYVTALDAMSGGSRGLESAVLSLGTQVADARAPLGALSFDRADTGLRILAPLHDMPVQIRLEATGDDDSAATTGRLEA